MQKAITNLWFDGRYEKVLELYTSSFDGPVAVERPPAALLRMNKLDIAELEKAFRNE